MITYNKEDRQILISECLSWEPIIKGIYDEEAEFWRDESEVSEEPIPIPPASDELSDGEIDEIMSMAAASLDDAESEDESFNVDDTVRNAVSDWLDNWVAERS